MRRCEDEKMRYRPPLLEEPCAQTLSGKKHEATKNKLMLAVFPVVDDGGDARRAPKGVSLADV